MTTPIAASTTYYSYPKNEFIAFTVTFKPKNKYFLNLNTLRNKAIFLGKGTTGSVMRAKFKVETSDGKIKEKEYALKLFNELLGFDQTGKVCLKEFNCHTKIIQKIMEAWQHLELLHITPGTGIEKRPLLTFCQENKNYMLKKLYDKNLNEAIQSGCFDDKKLLFLGSKQLLEGMISLMTIGALYFDIKTANILVRIKSSSSAKSEETKFPESMNENPNKLEVAFSDFEKVSFLQFNENDDKIINETFIRMPPFLAHEEELSNLYEIKKKEKPAKEFIEKLHKLYTFALGALFFEMTTKMSLKKFLILKAFTTFCLTTNGASPSQIAEFWKNGCEIKRDKDLGNLLQKIDAKDHQFFLGLILQTSFPDLELLKMEVLQKGLIDHILISGAPQSYAELVAAMLNPDADKRISIHEALQRLTRQSDSTNT